MKNKDLVALLQQASPDAEVYFKDSDAYSSSLKEGTKIEGITINQSTKTRDWLGNNLQIGAVIIET